MSMDIYSRIVNIFPTLSKGHKKIANAILNDYDKASFLTAAQLGRLVGVSESTVVRFAGELGFEGYSEFQRAVQELVRSKLTLNQRIDVTNKRLGAGDIIDSVMESDISKIRFTLEKIDRNNFNDSVDALLGARNIYVMGARSTEHLARLLSHNLSLIFDNVKFVTPTSSAEVFENMLNISSRDVLVAFSFPRYSSKMVNAVKFANSKGAQVIAFTDTGASPLAQYATYLLTAEADMASFMDSLVAPLSIINAIIVAITRKKEKEIRERFDALEKVWDEYDVYTK